MLHKRVESFCERFGLRVPILLAPMAGVPAPSLSVAVAKAGGLGACGVLLMPPEEIQAWVAQVRGRIDGPARHPAARSAVGIAIPRGGFQLNLWIPDPAPSRDAAHEARVRAFLERWTTPGAEPAVDRAAPDFDAQCEAMLDAAAAAISSIMGLYPAQFVERFRARGIAWFATVTTVAEARAAEAAGADVIVAQGSEAGGHRGAFVADDAERKQVGLFALLPAVVDAVRVPVVATGGIGDARGIAAALTLGASAVQIGTGFLRCPEAGIHPVWASALATTAPEDTMVSRVFSGRAGRSIANDYARAATGTDAPRPAPYPVQRGLTATMRKHAVEAGDIQRMQAWAGQSAAMASDEPAGVVVERLWTGAQAILRASA